MKSTGGSETTGPNDEVNDSAESVTHPVDSGTDWLLSKLEHTSTDSAPPTTPIETVAQTSELPVERPPEPVTSEPATNERAPRDPFDSILQEPDGSLTSSRDTGSFSWNLDRDDVSEPSRQPPDIRSDEPTSSGADTIEPPSFEASRALLARSDVAQGPLETDLTNVVPVSAGLEGPQLGQNFDVLPTPTLPAELSGVRPRRKDQPAAVGRRPRALVIGLVGAAVILLVIGLFVIGTRLSAAFSSEPAPTPTPTETPTPSVTPRVTVAAGPGEHSWNVLGGGECLQPFTSPWAQTFTVVDCGTAHSAQLVYTNLVSTDPTAAFPGNSALTSQVMTLCHAAGIVNIAAASGYTDLQMQVAFPATKAQWASGQRSYYCFVNRSGGGTITGSIAGPGPTS